MPIKTKNQAGGAAAQKKDEQMKKYVDPQRRMKGEKVVFHDLFKLEVKPMKKILGVPDPRLLEKSPHLVRMIDQEHCHFFHSVDSNGRPQKYSSSIGGHCHEVKITLDENGSFEAECGPPLRRHKNSRVEPIEPYDRHTHEIEYIESIEFAARKANQEAVKYASNFTTPAMPGGAA
jgi:hypothetical protein